MSQAPQTEPPPPRRNWHLARWFLVLIVVVFGWSAWQAYAYRTAIKEAKALGWSVKHTDPFEEIRKNWKAAFKKETWMDGVFLLNIPTGDSFAQNLTIVHRLNPRELQVSRASTLRDISSLKPLARLQSVSLYGCTGLTNVDALANLAALKEVGLFDCTGLANVDVMKNLSALHTVALIRCTGLTNVDALKSLSRLRIVSLNGCTGLTNVEGLNNLPALEYVYLVGCTGLKNVEELKSCPSLKSVSLKGCTGLTPESVAALKAARPNIQITGP